MPPQELSGPRRQAAALSLAALGVVYGDIGTSPLYAMKECFSPAHGLAPTEANVLGVLSLVTWSLLLVVVVKYLTFVMRASNRGEGGILALLALLKDKTSPRGRALVTLAVFGAALLYGDGMITPPVSVLSAVEGLDLVTDKLHDRVHWVAVGILLVLFLAQRGGTQKIASVFGPTMLAWFVVIGALGACAIARRPRVLAALSPLHGARFLLHHGLHGYLVLGAVVLCITGAEALYADLGQFGTRPIRLAWYTVVFPALLLSYFGQGALYLTAGQVDNPFFALAAGWLRYPLIALATVAAIIASQALISGAFSLTHQAVRLGFWPGVSIVHTSKDEEGQVYIPAINSILAIGCVAITLAFRTSARLAAAYGMAVTGTMAITSVLFYVVARETWGWSRARAGGIVLVFLAVDLAFLGANLPKAVEGGWLPLALAAAFFVVMTTWHRGRDVVRGEILAAAIPIDDFLAEVARKTPGRTAGIGVVLTPGLEVAPPVLLHFFRHAKVLHEHVVLLSVGTRDVPSVPDAERIVRSRDLGQGFLAVEVAFGFKQAPRIVEALSAHPGFRALDGAAGVSFLLGRESLTKAPRPHLARWRRLLFAFLFRNARPVSAAFALPDDRTVEIRVDVAL